MLKESMDLKGSNSYTRDLTDVTLQAIVRRQLEWGKTRNAYTTVKVGISWKASTRSSRTDDSMDHLGEADGDG
jgi:hypothetical protein